MRAKREAAAAKRAAAAAEAKAAADRRRQEKQQAEAQKEQLHLQEEAQERVGTKVPEVHVFVPHTRPQTIYVLTLAVA